MNNLAIRLAEAGGAPRALTAAQEAVDLRRELAALNRDAYLPDLAMSVNNLAIRLAEAERRAEALTDRPGSRRPVPGTGRPQPRRLPAQPGHVGQQPRHFPGRGGRQAEALSTAQEAVDLHRELTALNRDAYLPDLATSVNNHAIRLAEAGRRAEALLTPQEAVDLRRELAAGNRDAYLPDLATSLFNHAYRLEEVGRQARHS